MVIFDEQLTNNERLLCNECLKNFEGNVKIVGLQKVFSIIENNQKRKTENAEKIIMETKQTIEYLGTKVQNLKTKILQLLDQLQGIVEGWKNKLDQILQNTYIKYSFFEELDNLIKNKESKSISHENLMKTIEINNQSCQQKTLFLIDQLMSLQIQNEYQEFRKTLKTLEESTLNYYSEQKRSQNEIIINQKFDIELIYNQMQQPEYCRAISFNNSNQIMISTCNIIIRVFKFQNNIIEEICKLDGHSMNVNILIFSKLSNSFISGSADSTIRCWEQIESSQWKSSKPYKEHTGSILCAIINQKENLLFSAGEDQVIKIWILNFVKNQLEYLTKLNKHSGRIYGLSLNQSETQLVSCGSDKRIIIWKQVGNDWIFNYIVKQSIDDYGQKVKFLRDDLFIWVAANAGVYVFELNNGVFQEKNDKKIELQINNIKDCFLFPILYNPNKNLIIIRHKYCIYIIRETQKHKFQIVKTIKCLWNRSQGTITNDGQFLVFWDCENFQKNESSNGNYSIYRLCVN